MNEEAISLIFGGSAKPLIVKGGMELERLEWAVTQVWQFSDFTARTLYRVLAFFK